MTETTDNPQIDISPAQEWITKEAAYDGQWRNHGVLNFPTASMVIGAALDGAGHTPEPIRPPLTVFKLMTFGYDHMGPNGLAWLEGSGGAPARLGPCYAVRAENEMLTIADAHCRGALASLPPETADLMLRTQRRGPHFVSMMDVPGGAGRMALLSSGGRDPIIAATLLDESGACAGMLIDFMGRLSDGEHTAICLSEEAPA